MFALTIFAHATTHNDSLVDKNVSTFSFAAVGRRGGWRNGIIKEDIFGGDSNMFDLIQTF